MRRARDGRVWSRWRASLEPSLMSRPDDLRVLSHYVDGRRLPGSGKRFADVFNPATGVVQAHVPLASIAEVDAAVAAARTAWPSWAETAPVKRARILFRFKQLLDAHIDELATLIT